MRRTLSISITLFACLFIFSTVIFGQDVDRKIQNQPPVSAIVETQNDSPILIKITGVENKSEDHYQTVSIVLQNVTDKPIRAYTISGDGIVTSFSPRKFFQPYSFTDELSRIEKSNLERKNKVSYSVDFVLFKDGSVWGKDVNHESERVEGMVEGEKAALKELKAFIENADSKTLKSFLEQEIRTIKIPASPSDHSEKWQDGYRTGYGAIVSSLLTANSKEAKTLLKYLKAMSNFE